MGMGAGVLWGWHGVSRCSRIRGLSPLVPFGIYCILFFCFSLGVCMCISPVIRMPKYIRLQLHVLAALGPEAKMGLADQTTSPDKNPKAMVLLERRPGVTWLVWPRRQTRQAAKHRELGFTTTFLSCPPSNTTAFLTFLTQYRQRRTASCGETSWSERQEFGGWTKPWGTMIR